MSSNTASQAQSPSEPTDAPLRISRTAFQSASGCLLAVAVIVAVARIFARIRKEQRLYLDDALFFLATLCLIAGTTLVFIDMPYIYLQENVESSRQTPPADFLTQLIRSEKIQDAGTVLLATTIFSVKFSFLLFFRHLLRLQRKLIYYWWFICIILIPSAAVFMFLDFISCDYFDERIVSACSTPGALARQNDSLLASAILDILTDCFLISIPIILLWNIQISIRQKLVLCGILCLSVVMIIMAIIRVSTGKSSNGQLDSAWVIFWLQAEASVAIVVVSISAFRALFIAQKASRYNHQKSPGYHRRNSQAKSGTSRIRQETHLPGAPYQGQTGLDTPISHEPLNNRHPGGSVGDIELSLQDTDIATTKEVTLEEKDANSSALKAQTAALRQSTESFV